jgi:hypothetical protein
MVLKLSFLRGVINPCVLLASYSWQGSGGTGVSQVTLANPAAWIHVYLFYMSQC